MVRERITYTYLFVYTLGPCELLFFYFRRETFEESQPSFKTSHNFWLSQERRVYILNRDRDRRRSRDRRRGRHWEYLRISVAMACRIRIIAGILRCFLHRIECQWRARQTLVRVARRRWWSSRGYRGSAVLGCRVRRRRHIRLRHWHVHINNGRRVVPLLDTIAGKSRDHTVLSLDELRVWSNRDGRCCRIRGGVDRCGERWRKRSLRSSR